MREPPQSSAGNIRSREGAKRGRNSLILPAGKDGAPLPFSRPPCFPAVCRQDAQGARTDPDRKPDSRRDSRGRALPSRRQGPFAPPAPRPGPVPAFPAAVRAQMPAAVSTSGPRTGAATERHPASFRLLLRQAAATGPAAGADAGCVDGQVHPPLGRSRAPAQQRAVGSLHAGILFPQPPLVTSGSGDQHRTVGQTYAGIAVEAPQQTDLPGIPAQLRQRLPGSGGFARKRRIRHDAPPRNGQNRVHLPANGYCRSTPLRSQRR